SPSFASARGPCPRRVPSRRPLGYSCDVFPSGVEVVMQREQVLAATDLLPGCLPLGDVLLAPADFLAERGRAAAEIFGDPGERHPFGGELPSTGQLGFADGDRRSGLAEPVADEPAVDASDRSPEGL